MSSRMNGLAVSGAQVRGPAVPAVRTRRSGKWVVLGVALAAALAVPLGAAARGHDYRGGYSGSYYGGSHGNYGHGYYNRGYDRGYDRPVVYTQPRVVYDSYYPAPVVTRRVVETRTVYEDPYETRYIRSDGYED